MTPDPDPPPTPIGPEETRVDNNRATASVAVFASESQIPSTGFDGWILVRIATLVLAAGVALTLAVHRTWRHRRS